MPHSSLRGRRIVASHPHPTGAAPHRLSPLTRIQPERRGLNTLYVDGDARYRRVDDITRITSCFAGDDDATQLPEEECDASLLVRRVAPSDDKDNNASGTHPRAGSSASTTSLLVKPSRASDYLRTASPFIRSSLVPLGEDSSSLRTLTAASCLLLRACCFVHRQCASVGRGQPIDDDDAIAEEEESNIGDATEGRGGRT